MERVIYVEVLDRNGRVASREVARTLPFRIGRGYDCDLILDDPYASPHHAVIVEDPEGGLQIRDAGSRNGLAREGRKERVDAIALDGDVRVRLGRTVVQLRTPEFEVPEAIPFERRFPVVDWLMESPAALLVLPMLFLALTIYEQLRATTVEIELAGAFTTAAWTMLVFGSWVGIWALFNRLLRQRMRFVAHSTVAFSIAALATLGGWAVEWLRFVVEPIEPLLLADLVVTTGLWAVVLLGHLTVIGVARRARRIGIVVLGFAAILGLQLVEHYTEGDNWVATLPYWSRLKPVDPRWLPVESEDRFFAGVAQIEADLAELAAEANREESDDPS